MKFANKNGRGIFNRLDLLGCGMEDKYTGQNFYNCSRQFPYSSLHIKNTAAALR